ncbi:CbiX/SirB N-terminal domain-containing protein, partial [Streptomyces sp. SID11385]|uniref:CbiX/SirB N-terminal domain-containing protein n=1 Tax=Streptomyces sp. SID11385 TaxID=2706031 RepID=UPI0013CD1DB9
APVVLAAAGSGDARARADTLTSARLLSARLGAPVTAAFLGGEGPDPATALASWPGQDVSVAPHLLAPGFFARRLDGLDVRVAAPLGAERSVVELVWGRYEAGVRGAWAGARDGAGVGVFRPGT